MMRKDLLTGEQFKPTRISQKFAKPENRIRYYNIKANKLRHRKSFVDKPLHNNIKVLDELLKDKEEEVFHRQFLMGRGLNLNLHSHLKEYEGANRFAIYNYIIVPLENQEIKIIRYD